MQGKAILTTGAVIFNKKNQVLLVRHTEKASHLTDTYGIPAGRPEGDEAIQDACVREVNEETGLEIKKEDLKRFPQVYYAKIKRKDGENVFVLIAYYLNKFSGELRASDENEPEWINISELENINLLGNQKDLIIESLKLMK